MEDKYIKEYYKNYDEDGRLEKKHQKIEFLTTTRYIDRYLKKDMKILEVGAGTGRYSLFYAHQGYDVSSLELVPHNIEILKSKIRPNDNISVCEGNALNLEMYEDNTFDITLVLGPMYHVYNEKDKNQVVKEAIRVTKKNGLIYIAYITHDAVIVDWGLVNGNLADGIEENRFTDDYKCKSSPKDLFAMFHIDEFNDLIKPFSVKHLHTVGSDGVAPFFDEIFLKMDDRMYNHWINYHFASCERKDLIGYSSHIIWIGKKL